MLPVLLLLSLIAFCSGIALCTGIVLTILGVPPCFL
jgi:hypothetical protein